MAASAIHNLEMDAHALEPAVVLRFDDAAKQQQQRKIIQLNGLSEHSDTAAVARLVADQCKPLIPPGRLSELEQLIFYIQKRHAPGKADSNGLPITELRAKLENLEDYMELLYEEGEQKQRGVALLSELVQHVEPAHLINIVDNEQLMGALTRVWREDSRKNFELAIHLAQLFYRLSQFAPFHSALSHWKIGLLTLQLVDYELHRWEMWRQQTAEMDEHGKRKWEFAMRKQDQLISLGLRILLNLADDLRNEAKMLKKGILPMLFKALEHCASPQLLLAAVKFLWKLSQFTENQAYIANSESTIERLVGLLSVPNFNSPQSSSSVLSNELLSALCSLLFNCSFESVARRRMVSAGLVSLLAPHISGSNIALALMYQLSIVEDAKAMIAFTDCIPILMDILLHGDNGHAAEDEQQQQQNSKRVILAKSLLVNILLEKRNAQLLCGSDGQGLDALMAFALDDEHGDVLAMKIARNIASHEGPTRDMFLKWVPQLVENAIEKEGSSSSNSTRNPIVNDSGSVFGLECMGICALLTSAPWTELDNQRAIVPFLERILRRSTEQVQAKSSKRHQPQPVITDDVLLQVVQWCGTLAGHSLEMAERVEKQLLPLIVATLNKRQEDDEMVLQCAFVFVCLIAHGGALAKRICAAGDESIAATTPNEGDQQATAKQPPVVALLLNLMHDRNPRLRALCEQALQQIAEVNTYWRQRIQEARFRWHNAQWLELVQEPMGSSSVAINGVEHGATQQEDGSIIIDGEHVVDTDQLLKGTEF